jgi:hypothetical protein
MGLSKVDDDDDDDILFIIQYSIYRCITLNWQDFFWKIKLSVLQPLASLSTGVL